MAYHVRIDRVTQGPDGMESQADRLHIDSTDFLWIYVEAQLPSSASPFGEYFREGADGRPDPTTRIPLEPPSHSEAFYRFSVIHYVLSPQTRYWFHFADDLSNPTYQDQWEVVTI